MKGQGYLTPAEVKTGLMVKLLSASADRAERKRVLRFKVSQARNAGYLMNEAIRKGAAK